MWRAKLQGEVETLCRFTFYMYNDNIIGVGCKYFTAHSGAIVSKCGCCNCIANIKLAPIITHLTIDIRSDVQIAKRLIILMQPVQPLFGHNIVCLVVLPCPKQRYHFFKRLRRHPYIIKITDGSPL